MMKKVAIIGTRGIPACYGGFESLAGQLVQHLSDRFDFTVYCQKSAFAEHPETIGNVHLKYINLSANGMQSIPYDIVSIFDALRYADTLLILGVSGCVLLPLIRWFVRRKKIICNIDGIEWRRAKWSKFAQWYLRFAEFCAVKCADVVICDNQVIVEYVKNTYHRDCALIEYGADSQPWGAR